MSLIRVNLAGVLFVESSEFVAYVISRCRSLSLETKSSAYLLAELGLVFQRLDAANTDQVDNLSA